MEAFQWIVSDGRFYEAHEAAAKAWQAVAESLGAELTGACSAHHIAAASEWTDALGTRWVVKGQRTPQNHETNTLALLARPPASCTLSQP